MAAKSWTDQAVTMITETIPNILVHNLERFQSYYSSGSSSSKQTVDDPQTEAVQPVLPVNAVAISISLYSLSEQGDNTGDDDLGFAGDHCIRIDPSPSPVLPENILRLVQNLNNTLNPDGANNPNHHHQQNPNLRLSVLQKAELGKMVFGVVVPITMGLLMVIWSQSSSSAPLPRLMVLFVVSTLSFGSAFIWDGILLRDMLPRTARGLEELGISMVFLAFFALVSSTLPVDLLWAAWLCYLLTVLPIVVLWFHDTGGPTP